MTFYLLKVRKSKVWLYSNDVFSSSFLPPLERWGHSNDVAAVHLVLRTYILPRACVGTENLRKHPNTEDMDNGQPGNVPSKMDSWNTNLCYDLLSEAERESMQMVMSEPRPCRLSNEHK